MSIHCSPAVTSSRYRGRGGLGVRAPASGLDAIRRSDGSTAFKATRRLRPFHHRSFLQNNSEHLNTHLYSQLTMKSKYLLTLVAAGCAAARALALTIPSDGSDGDFNPTADIVVDLSLAPAGAWDASNTANAGKGIYDSSKWAVVFKHASVNIPSGVTVTFINHPTHAPVVWLVSGNVTIDGTVSVKGGDGPLGQVDQLTPAEPGPGGFRAGAAGPAGKGRGYGPGADANSDGPGRYGLAYGNPQIVPLIGGSGAGIYGGGLQWSGGAGGGAILIASAGSISIQGMINANGGDPHPGKTGGNLGGSGGAVRLIAEQVSGNGEIQAINPGDLFGFGRIRIETPVLAPTVRTAPETVAVIPAAIPILWPADDAPTVHVVSVDGVVAPVDPTAALVSSADVQIQQNGTVQVLLETKNFPPSGFVQLRTVQKYGPAAWVTAAHSEGDFAASTWIADVTFAPGFTTLQARATVP